MTSRQFISWQLHLCMLQTTKAPPAHAEGMCVSHLHTGLRTSPLGHVQAGQQSSHPRSSWLRSCHQHTQCCQMSNHSMTVCYDFPLHGQHLRKSCSVAPP